MIISLLVAMDLNRGIGKNNRIPWHVSSDLRRFKKITMGHHIIMGRKTYESIGRQLPGRKMLILSNRHDYRVEDGIVFNSIDAAIKYASDNDESEVFIIGGGDIFDQCIKFADRIYLSIIEAMVDADVFFPFYLEDEWQLKHHEFVDLRNGDQYAYTYRILERKQQKQAII